MLQNIEMTKPTTILIKMNTRGLSPDRDRIAIARRESRSNLCSAAAMEKPPMRRMTFGLARFASWAVAVFCAGTGTKWPESVSAPRMMLSSTTINGMSKDVTQRGMASVAQRMQTRTSSARHFCWSSTDDAEPPGRTSPIICVFSYSGIESFIAGGGR